MASIYSGISRSDRNELPIGSRRTAIANAGLARLWKVRPGWKPRLDSAEILGGACRIAGGPADRLSSDWLFRLDLLLHDLEASARLTPLGRTLAYGQLASAAANMIGMHKLWAQHPEIDNQSVERPIVIVGQMRSGTTRMQRLLACDERFRFTRFYESWAPLPRIASSRLFDDRKWRARLGLFAARILNPEFQSIHPTGAAAADEEIGFFNMLMLPAAYEAQWRLPSFLGYCEAMNKISVYAEFRRILKTIAWLRGRDDKRPWILKVPQFAEDLDAMLAVFPDARVVHVTRDENMVAASSASLVFNQMKLQSNEVDPHAIGREWSRKISLRAARTATALSAAAAPRTEIRYADIERDWRRAIREVYTMLKTPLDEAAEHRMNTYLCSRKSRARHHYEPAAFGLTA